MLTVVRLQVLAKVYARQAQQESLLRLGQSTPGMILCLMCDSASIVQLHTYFTVCEIFSLCRPS